MDVTVLYPKLSMQMKYWKGLIYLIEVIGNLIEIGMRLSSWDSQVVDAMLYKLDKEYVLLCYYQAIFWATL